MHDLSRRKSRVSALHWLGEVAKLGTFSSPSMPRRPGLLPVPLLVIGNKVDVPEIDPVLKGANKLWQYMQGSRGVRAAKSWAERNQLLGFGRATDLPDYIRNPHSSGLIAVRLAFRLDSKASRTDAELEDCLFVLLRWRAQDSEMPCHSWQMHVYVPALLHEV